MSPAMAENLMVWFLVFGTVALVLAIFVASSVVVRREEPREGDAPAPASLEGGAAFALFFTSAICALAILALALYRWWPT